MKYEKLKKAFEIAKQDLRSRYTNKGILAGTHNFTDIWARDSFFASFGSVSLQDLQQVKKNLTTFARYQNSEGLIPMRIGAYNIKLKLFLNFFGINPKFKTEPRYIDDKGSSVVMDSNPLFIISAYELIKANPSTANKLIRNLTKAADWCFVAANHPGFSENRFSEPLLIPEKPYGSWTDSVKKKGFVLYTNILLWYSLKCLSKMLSKYFKNSKSKQNTSRKYAKAAAVCKHSINKYFWTGQYYCDTIDNDDLKKKDLTFSADGNFLAIWLGLCSKSKSKSILRYATTTPICRVPCMTNYPAYPSKHTDLTLRILGMGNYHNNSMAWLWLGALLALAQHRAGLKKAALATLNTISGIICKFGTVPEVLNSHSEPVRLIFYKSDMSFAWSAGMFIRACNTILGKEFPLN